MQTWNFLVDRFDLSRTRLQPADGVPAIAAGEALIAIERFSFTANNITYGVAGDRLGYWRFFPAADPWGRLPVWGFATVVGSRADGIQEGLRVFGLLPMSSHVLMELRQTPDGLVDSIAHRQAMSPFYNRYQRAAQTPYDDEEALLRPLFTTSFLLDDTLGGDADLASATVVLSSASSKTALGLAWLLTRRGVRVVGLTSQRHHSFVEGTGFYSDVVSYDAISSTDAIHPVVFVDFAGNAEALAAVHHRFGDRLVRSVIVGRTHRDRGAPRAVLPGPVPTLFFAPDQLLRRSEEWGARQLSERVSSAMRAFLAQSGWLRISNHIGAEGLADVYGEVLRGDARPEDGHIIMPSPS